MHRVLSVELNDNKFDESESNSSLVKEALGDLPFPPPKPANEVAQKIRNLCCFMYGE